MEDIQRLEIVGLISHLDDLRSLSQAGSDKLGHLASEHGLVVKKRKSNERLGIEIEIKRHVLPLFDGRAESSIRQQAPLLAVTVNVNKNGVAFDIEERLHRVFEGVAGCLHHRSQQHEEKPEPRLVLIVGYAELAAEMGLVRLAARQRSDVGVVDRGIGRMVLPERAERVD